MSKGKEEVAVLRYLTEQNRPYSVNDILLNMRKEIGKAALQKALDKLTQEDKVREKTYGKQKVYFVNQKDLGQSTPEELKAMDVKIDGLEKSIQETEGAIKNVNSELKDILPTLTTEDATKEVDQYTEEVRVMEIKQKNLAENVVCVDTTERDSIRRDRTNALHQWRKRKLLAVDMADAIFEYYPLDLKELYDDMKIETDEDVGAVFPATTS